MHFSETDVQLQAAFCSRNVGMRGLYMEWVLFAIELVLVDHAYSAYHDEGNHLSAKASVWAALGLASR